MRGKFITFEGADGGGKTTQAAHLATHLREKSGLSVLETREPGGTEFGMELRKILLSNDEIIPFTETMLLFAARQEHLRQKILPALADGAWVVCDRFSDSSIAYQGGGGRMSADFLETLIDHMQGYRLPDLTIYLKSPPALAPPPLLEADVFERRNAEFFQRVRASFDDIAKNNKRRVAVVAAMRGGKRRSEKEVTAEITELVEKRLLRDIRPSAARPPSAV